MSSPDKQDSVRDIANANAAPMRDGPAGHGALLVYALAIVYASLNPFFGWREPEVFTLFVWPKFLNTFDIVLNIVAYMPLGGMLAARQLHLDQPNLPKESSASSIRSGWVVALLAGFALSATMETAQAFLPVRVASPVDLLTNTAGSLLGAGLLLSGWGRQLLGRVLAWRSRHFSSAPWTGWGLLLLAAWFFSQMNPLIPFFEAGLIPVPVLPAESGANGGFNGGSYDPLILLPQAVGITLNVCGFALFVSLLIAPGRRRVSMVLTILSLGLIVKVGAAALTLKAPQLASWVGPATVIGLSSGLLLFTFFSGIAFRWRALWTTLFIFAGGLMAKLASFYGLFDETLRLVKIPLGHLASFAGLTRWVHEIWPLLACLLAAWIFIRHHESQSIK